MRKYNKILEAVNRGIQLALDDFDDEEQVQNVKSKQVYNKDYTKEYLDFMKDVVDLGLPSGTLWCKYNLGVNPIQLTEPGDWYGDYYAWGELEGNKPEFSWSNYKFGKLNNKLTKYCNNPKYGLNGFTDNLTKLQLEDDVAYQTKKLYNYKFHIPTKEQCEELINYTNNYWVKNYDPNKIKHNPKNDKGLKGLNGQVFEGKNGNQLFIPAAGYDFHSANIDEVGSICHLRTSNLDLADPDFACSMCIDSDYIYMSYGIRCFGFSVRPVINNKIINYEDL